MMEIKFFRLIKTIAEEGNIVNSSEKLFLTQSALSHQLIVLEERLGFKVFHRSRNKWKLTKEGEELYKLANEVLNSIEKGFNKIKYLKEGSAGTIKLSTECYSFYQGIPAFIQKMGVLYPEIEIELNLEATPQPITKLLSHEIDLAIVTSKPNAESLACVALQKDEIFAVMHKEHALSTKNHLDAEDFRSVHLIIHTFPLESVAFHNLYLKPNKINPKKISAVPFTEVTLEMVNANMGITCLPLSALKSFKISEDIVFKKIGPNGLNRKHFLVVKKEDQGKKYIDDFMNCFEEDFVDG